ncbi:endoplasmic reticulum oxidoreductin, putative [Plasmodium vinckei brucechwatti]|uniref:Endoplasmic reticulum oxidoreductin, putative n=1 Tax=Plasmodium vinckei brucechwatti TaxID=119398 RepID=A0A6V7S5V5_PLAVN|nr:endoplasmic reticulum oxidoreductin, putative [Plasmodium vinckei brucechwatti]
MKIYLISYVFPLMVYLLYTLLKDQRGFSQYNDYLMSKINDALLYFNIYEIKFPNSYLNNEKILGLHIQDIEEDSRVAYEILKELTQKNYFRIFKVNLHIPCKLQKISEKCNEKTKCSVCECTEDEIPYNFRTNEVEIIHDQYAQEDLKQTFIASKLYKDILGTYDPSNEGFLSYVDLIYNSPSYTAYEGKSIWNRIYLENCFQNGENTCTEMNNFYKIISGMQSCIAALSSEYYYLKNDFVFGDMHTDHTIKNHYIKKIDYDYNISFFKEKLALYPDRIENLYFTFAVLLRALCRLKPLFSQCKCNSGIKENDKDAFNLLNEFLGKHYHSCSSEEFLEPIFPNHGKEILSKFMNITSILDCVPCIKCKLHGKLKTTALQIALVEGVGHEHIGSLERNEATALINAIYHFADAILIIKKFEERLKLKKTLFIFYVVSVTLFILLVLLSVIYITIRARRKKKKIKAVKKNT